MSTNTQEQGGGREQGGRERGSGERGSGECGPFLLAKVLADTLVTTIGRPRPAGDPASPEARPAACRRCGGEAHWHRTVRGKWILIEPGEYPTHTVPAGQRWRIAPDGTAVNLGAASPTDTCRVSHFHVCAESP
ncbi:DUF6083 domain-containing protein [Streptomyces sp. NBC_00091]|uniref:DUF6083 domain-containing protein n=1 Tax=Streptomyces sp. NBC_00091 TaxID=2975648 RepID=UPI00225496AE|nr:DUF6083 domain-containing protein [Streptomyces sp. NBC_00091]MCX5376255.1 DUF6083 domain-containing protein [Streptomyces sp. NBC_00091]